MPEGRILVVGGDTDRRTSLTEHFTRAGYEVSSARDGESALACRSTEFDLILLDYELPDVPGHTVLRRLKASDPEVEVIAVAPRPNVRSAVEAMKLGCFEFLQRPLDLEVTETVVAEALDHTQSRRELRRLRRGESQQYGFDQIIGSSAAIARAKTLLERVAHSPASTVLLTGESGTGKDLAAKAIHFNSSRLPYQFMNITCSALPETLLESELFGHERGAFTDAKQRKRGLLELAHQGTVFLDEIGEMTPHLQAKVLRFLEEKSFRRVGGQEDIKVDVRVIAATNRDLRADVDAGRFRDDLFYRLNVLPIELPPLRDRHGDIPLLTAHFVERMNREFSKRITGVTADAARRLEQHGWPGNVRELKNLVERAMLLAGQSGVLKSEDFLTLNGSDRCAHGYRLPPDGVDLEDVERSLVIQALERTHWNQSAAARMLRLHRDQIRYRIKKFGLVPPDRRG